MPETPERAPAIAAPRVAGSTRRDPWVLLAIGAAALIARIVLAVTHHGDAPATRAATATQPDLVRWVAADSAEAVSRATGKPILYEFGADWCGPCQAMTHDIFSQPALARAVEGYVVPVRVTDRQREQGRNPPGVDSLQTACGVNAFPTLALVSRGQVIDRQVGYPGAAVTMGWLARASDHGHPPRRN